MGTNLLIENLKNKGFGPLIGDKHAQKWELGTRGLISIDLGHNRHKQNTTNEIKEQESYVIHTNIENLTINGELNNNMQRDRIIS